MARRCGAASKVAVFVFWGWVVIAGAWLSTTLWFPTLLIVLLLFAILFR